MGGAILTTYSASDILRLIAEREISLTPTFDGRIWSASVDEFGSNVASKRRKVRSISATSSTPAGAVRALIEKLDAMPQSRPLVEELAGIPF
jgi:hypothetical protein